MAEESYMEIDLLLEKILYETGFTNLDRVSTFLVRDIFKALIVSGSIKEASILLSITDSKLEHVLSRNLTVLFPEKIRSMKWRTFLLSLIGYRICSVCNIIDTIDRFISSPIRHKCKICDNSSSKVYSDKNRDKCRLRSKKHYLLNKHEYLLKSSKRRRLLYQAMPLWADTVKIKEIYNNCPSGYHVDHIVPLQGELVSGLHVENNLQYLLAKDNLEKSNKFNGE